MRWHTGDEVLRPLRYAAAGASGPPPGRVRVAGSRVRQAAIHGRGRTLMFDDPDALCPCGHGLRRCRLVARLQQGLPLSDQPFADIGRDCGLTEDEVLGRLHRMLARGLLRHLGPLRVNGGASVDAPVAPGGLGARLLATTESGLPLVARPYEALAAMLGVDAPAVREQLQQLLDSGQLAQIGVRLGDAARRP
jgi:hypothetical protein